MNMDTNSQLPGYKFVILTPRPQRLPYMMNMTVN